MILHKIEHALCLMEEFRDVYTYNYLNFREKRRDYGERPEYGALSFKVIENIDDYSDEELDEIGHRRTQNTDKHIAPVYIMEKMINESNKNNRFGPSEITKWLNWKGIKVERKAVSRTLRQLEEADYLCEDPNEPSKYWYDSETLREAREDPLF